MTPTTKIPGRTLTDLRARLAQAEHNINSLLSAETVGSDFSKRLHDSYKVFRALVLDYDKWAKGQENPWVPVERDMPGHGQKVLVLHDDMVDACFVTNGRFVYRDGSTQYGVTHWMPLPEGPKEPESHE